MRILILGGSGRTGQLVIDEALRRGISSNNQLLLLRPLVDMDF